MVRAHTPTVGRGREDAIGSGEGAAGRSRGEVSDLLGSRWERERVTESTGVGHSRWVRTPGQGRSAVEVGGGRRGGGVPP
jgi:hypothetical protein